MSQRDNVDLVFATLKSVIPLNIRSSCPVLSGNMLSHISTTPYGADGIAVEIAAPYYDVNAFMQRRAQFAGDYEGEASYMALTRKKGRQRTPIKLKYVPKVFSANSPKQFRLGRISMHFEYAKNVNDNGAFNGRSKKSKGWIYKAINQVVGSCGAEVIFDI